MLNLPLIPAECHVKEHTRESLESQELIDRVQFDVDLFNVQGAWVLEKSFHGFDSRFRFLVIKWRFMWQVLERVGYCYGENKAEEFKDRDVLIRVNKY